MTYSRADPLLMIPGPTPVSAAVREAMGSPVRGHGAEETADSTRRIREGLRQIVNAPEADVYVLPGSGTLAMEAALVNHVGRGDRVLIVSHGWFGERFGDICAAHGIACETIRAPWGQAVPLEDVARAARERDPTVLIATHVDTSTGVLADARRLAAIAKDAGSLMLLDAVCATGGVAEDMDTWGIDVLVTASQKALSGPPGLALIVRTQSARARGAALGGVSEYYVDLARWDKPMNENTYFATPATTLVRALDVSVREILAEGMERRQARHLQVAAELRSAFEELGFRVLTDASSLAPTLTVAAPPDGTDEAELRTTMLDRGVLVAGGIGEFAGRSIRIGHMGTCDSMEIALTVEAARPPT